MTGQPYQLRGGRGQPRTPLHVERQNLRQKQRLEYLLGRYAPSWLRGVELYRRLRLRSKEEGQIPARIGSPALPDPMAKALEPVSERNFGFLLETDVTLRQAGRYQPSQGLKSSLCDALGWVITVAYEHWPASILHNEASIRDKATDLSRFILSGDPQPAAVFFGLPKTRAREVTEDLLRERAPHHLCRSFLRGSDRPGLSIVNSGATIPRSIEEDLLAALRDAPERVVLLTGAAGDGKSTLMYRLAAKLFDEGWRVFFKDEWLGDQAISCALGEDERVNTVLFVDRAERLRNIDALYDWVLENPGLRVVLATREIDWLTRAHLRSSRRHKHFNLPRLTDAEIAALAALLVERQAAVPPCSQETLKQRLHLSVHSNHPHMLAAVMTACRDTDFSTILTSLVDTFPEPKLLRRISLCSLHTDRDGRPQYASSPMLWALFVPRETPPANGRRKFVAIHHTVRSEVISVADGYDLRHPDIGQFVLDQSYHCSENGVFLDVHALADDLVPLIADAAKVFMSRTSPAGGRMPFPAEIIMIARSWYFSDRLSNPALGRRLFDTSLSALGDQESRSRPKADICDAWVQCEASRAQTDPSAIEVLRTILPMLVKLLHGASGDRLYKAFEKWIEIEAVCGNRGILENPEPGSARGILRQMWEYDDGRFRGSKLMRDWIALETDPLAFGDFIAPERYSIRHMLREVWSERRGGDPNLVISWARFERQLGKLGSFDDPASNTARWIYREAWKEENRARLCNANLMVSWSQLEAASSNIGKAHDDDGNPIAPEPYTARWIFREAWKDLATRPEADSNRASLCNADLIGHWGEMEAVNGNVGKIQDDDGNPIAPEPYTARWIFREAWKDLATRFEADGKRTSLCNADVVRRWGDMEAVNGNVGKIQDDDGNPIAPEPYTARWIFREAWTLGIANQEVLFDWALCEYQANNFGSIDDLYSARWCFDQHERHPSRSKVPTRWLASMLAQEGDIVGARLHYLAAASQGHLSIMREWAIHEQAAGTVEGSYAPALLYSRWCELKGKLQPLPSFAEWMSGSGVDAGVADLQ